MFLLRFFRTPTAYYEQPWKYVLNQIGHAYIVGFLPVLFFGWLAVPILAAGYAAWEYAQMRLFHAVLSDGLEDLGHVLMGAVAALFPWVIVPHLILIASGYFLRREMAGRF